MEDNFTIQHQLNHRTIRFFQDKPVEYEKLTTIFEVLNRTATSSGMQHFSVIHVTDPLKKKNIAEIGRQAYIAEAPVLLIFLVDIYRAKQICDLKGYEGENYRLMDMFFQGVADAYLAAQNVTNAVEALGLGANFLGSILNDPQAIIDLFALPELTFPLIGVSFGYPNDSPQLKPRMPLKYKVGENCYPYFDDIVTELKDYDAEMTHYYDTREKNRRSDTFTDQMVRKVHNTIPSRAQMMRVIEQQGFDLWLED